MNMNKRKRELPLVEKIRQAIQDCGLSHNDLARKSGVSQPQLSRFLAGERTLTLPAAAKVCEALGLRLVGPKARRRQGGFSVLPAERLR
jgi:transcriptional regulator with XRE-family HTH domain